MKDRTWKAAWIWGGLEASPRNQWRCFRHTFHCPADYEGAAQLRISADSRYCLYVNGQLVGRGPNRSWPSEQSYDPHEVGHLLRPGKMNSIAVLVLHFGVANFYYIRGRGGLIAELLSGNQILAATDGQWKTATLAGGQPNSPRMCCQQGFAETIDARMQQGDWTSTTFDDAAWEFASPIAPSEAPWGSLIERDIPFLTEEKYYPSTILSLHRVRPATYTAALDLRNQMVPESANHANRIEYCGYLATKLKLTEKGTVTVGFPNGMRTDYLLVDGTLQEEWYGEQPERYYRLHLEAGEHLLLIDITCCDHGGSFHIAADGDIPFSFLSPQGDRTVPFITIGPFDQTERVDHQEDHLLRRDHPLYLSLKTAKTTEDLLQAEPWIRPMEEKLYTEEDVFGANVWRTIAERRALPLSMQNAILPVPEPAVLPLFEDGDCELVIDLGKERSGYLGFELEAPEGTIVDVYGVEYRHEHYTQHTYGLDNTFRYHCKAGRQHYLSPVRRGLRYLILTVRGNKTPVKLYEVFMNQSTYPVAETGQFTCSDPLLNQIWEISRHTTRLCMEDTFVDCPAYEQVFWVGDSRNEALVNYYVFGTTDIVKRCLSLVPKSADMSPLYVDQVPSAWSSVIPNWTFFWITACEEYIAHTLDIGFAKEIWPAVRFTLVHYIQHLDPSMLLNIKGWNLLDWAPIDQPNEGIVTHQNMFLVKALRTAIALAETAGLASEAADSGFAAIAGEMAAAINRQLWSEERKAYLDCIHTDGRASKIFSMQTQVVACLCGLVEGDRKSVIEGYLCSPPAEFVQIGSPFMSFFYYEALEKAGKYNLMLEDIRHHYGKMVEHDATTCWEMYPDFAENRANPKQLTRSHCHAWSASPGYFLGASILGIKRLDPGWSSVEIAPQPCDLQWAKGAVPLPQGGQIEVSWSMHKSVMTLRVEAPEDVDISIRWPEGIEGQLEQITYLR
ncbi:MAG: glycoside hydrolase family 78 protein [Gorillibacterium sp.]|nr:glycoside hydrolase family 78 protein [Gorillibacterium sp.]